MVNVESVAVGAVSGMVARCPLLMAELASNDKTPFTDGFIYVYKSDKQSNLNTRGRIPVQIKGRTHPGKIKDSASSVTYPIKREELEFFKQDGGVIYFYVPVSPAGYPKGVFHESLTPFRINRLLLKMKPGQKSLSVKLKRFVDDIDEIQQQVSYALDSRKQANTRINVDEILPQLTSMTLRTRTPLSDEHPTVLNVTDTNFSIEGTLPGGTVLPLDLDLVVTPGHYAPEPMDVDISCGGVTFESPTRERIDAQTTLITLSGGLSIRATRDGRGLRTSVSVSADGTFYDQVKNLNFFLAAAGGAPLVIGDLVLPPDRMTPDDEGTAELELVRDNIQKMIAALDTLDLSPDLARSIQLTSEQRQHLLMLHNAFVAGEEILINTSGVGGMNITLGDYQVTALVSEGSDESHRKIIDPFNPKHRGEFRLLRQGEDGKPMETQATIYEALRIEDIGRTLNLHVDSIADAYAAINDRNIALSTANDFVLNLLRAADVAEAPMRDFLLRGAGNLCDWLVAEGKEDLTYLINRWQTWSRSEKLTTDVERQIRSARREVRSSGPDEAHMLEACLTILLGEFSELALLLDEFGAVDKERLQEWPIWSLVPTADAVVTRDI